MTHSWQAPYYISSVPKIIMIILVISMFSFLLTFAGVNPGGSFFIFITLSLSFFLKLFLRKKDPHARYIQLIFKKKYAKHTIENNNLNLCYDKKNDKILLDKNILTSNIVPELHKFYSSPKFNIIYLIKKGLLFTKYIPIFIPVNRFDEITQIFKDKTTYISNEKAKESGELKVLKYFGYTLVFLILFITIFLIVYKFKCDFFNLGLPRNTDNLFDA